MTNTPSKAGLLSQIFTVPPDVERAILPALRQFPHQRYDYAPYGLLWYLVSKPLAWPSYSVMDYLVYSWIINWVLVGVLGVLRFPAWFLVVYVAVSVFNMLKAPWNLPVLWLSLLGFVSPFLIVIAPLAKFPVGNPRAKLWQVRQALTWQKNPVYYGTLIIVWLAVLILSVSHLPL